MSVLRLLRYSLPTLALFTVAALSLLWQPAQATPRGAIDPAKARVIEHWTPERRAAAIPRDLVIDPRGLGYLRKPDGTLVPYGHQVAAANSAVPLSKPGSTVDDQPPVINNMDPADGDTITPSYTLKATVTDNVGIKSVTFYVTLPDGTTTRSFSPTLGANDVWSIALTFSDGTGPWSWQVVAKDTASRGGNSTTSPSNTFTVDSGNSGSGGGSGSGSTGSTDVIADAQWSASYGGAVQYTAGRLYFEMPRNSKWTGPWVGYVCSGTVVTDGTSGRSIIQTASHCVYDDANKAFARNVMFIPDQEGTTASGTDLNCNNDPLGCWVPSFGVVDKNWAIRTFPDNIAWDYAYYVVADSGAHLGNDQVSGTLDSAVDSFSVSFSEPNHDTPASDHSDYTFALGYSYSDDPNLMYCAEDMATEQGQVDWWLGSCGLSGGSSGGPWLQPMDTGTGVGTLISVNSWGYTNSPGMAGPMLFNNSASCLFDGAKSENLDLYGSQPDGEAGVIVDTSSGCPYSAP